MAKEYVINEYEAKAKWRNHMNVLCICLQTSFSEKVYINKIIVKPDDRKEWHCVVQISNYKCYSMFPFIEKKYSSRHIIQHLVVLFL